MNVQSKSIEINEGSFSCNQPYIRTCFVSENMRLLKTLARQMKCRWNCWDLGYYMNSPIIMDAGMIVSSIKTVPMHLKILCMKITLMLVCDLHHRSMIDKALATSSGTGRHESMCVTIEHAHNQACEPRV